MYIVALTGGIGSGKSVVSRIFQSLNISIVDDDIIARQIVQPGTPALRAIVKYFGNKIINSQGILNRCLLREQIFSSSEKKHWLNMLLHPLIYKETQRQIRNATSPYVIWVSPLLIENQLYQIVDRVLVIDTTPKIQTYRTMIRDKVSKHQAQQILRSQTSREKRLFIADDVINNDNNTVSSILPHINKLHKKYLFLAL